MQMVFFETSKYFSHNSVLEIHSVLNSNHGTLGLEYKLNYWSVK